MIPQKYGKNKASSSKKGTREMAAEKNKVRGHSLDGERLA